MQLAKHVRTQGQLVPCAPACRRTAAGGCWQPRRGWPSPSTRRGVGSRVVSLRERRGPMCVTDQFRGVQRRAPPRWGPAQGQGGAEKSRAEGCRGPQARTDPGSSPLCHRPRPEKRSLTWEVMLALPGGSHHLCVWVAGNLHGVPSRNLCSSQLSVSRHGANLQRLHHRAVLGCDCLPSSQAG